MLGNHRVVWVFFLAINLAVLQLAVIIASLLQWSVCMYAACINCVSGGIQVYFREHKGLVQKSNKVTDIYKFVMLTLQGRRIDLLAKKSLCTPEILTRPIWSVVALRLQNSLTLRRGVASGCLSRSFLYPNLLHNVQRLNRLQNWGSFCGH